MKYGFVIPGGDDIRGVAELAREIEDAGWDGAFIPDCISIDTPDFPPSPWFDPWITLAAMAVNTERIRLGTMITPVSRRRPWKLAHELTSLDHLSGGRMVLPAGLGAARDDAGFYKVGEATARKERASMLTEGLEIISGLWGGEGVHFSGAHYKVEGLTLLPRPVQEPRIPIWVVAAWPSPRSMGRVLKYEGILPAKMGEGGEHIPLTPEDIREIRQYAEEHRDGRPIDIIIEREASGEDRAKAGEAVRPYAEAGVTWWLEAMWSDPDWKGNIKARIRQGPPRI